MNFKNALEHATKFYNNTHQIVQDKEFKSIIKDTYNKYLENIDNKLLSDIFSDESNFELYNSKYTSVSTPPIIIVKQEILDKHEVICESSIFYVLDKQTGELEYPLILISGRLFEQGNEMLLNFVILHEIGHYRASHTDKDRSILNEIEADLYAYESLGLERFIGGYNGLIEYLTDNDINANIDEIHKRVSFILRNKGVFIRAVC